MRLKDQPSTKKDAQSLQISSEVKKRSLPKEDDRTPVGSLNKVQNIASSAEKVQGQGKLSDWSSRSIIDYLNGKNFTGSLLLSHDGRKKRIWFEAGQIVRVQSNLIPELLGERLIQKGWIQKEDVAEYLEIQQKSRESISLGAIAQERAHLSDEELGELLLEQQTFGLVQAMGWSRGEYLFKTEPKTFEPDPLWKMMKWHDIRLSIQRLFEVVPVNLGPLFEKMIPWTPSSTPVDLKLTPLWSVLAGCRKREVSGILSIRKQNRLYEIVIKEGIPLTLYEGSFHQPRTTMILRRANDETERSFVQEIYRLFSFVTGTVSLRLFDNIQERKAIAQMTVQKEILTESKTEEDEDESLAFQLRSQFLSEEKTWVEKTYTGVSKQAHYWMDGFKNLKNLWKKKKSS